MTYDDQKGTQTNGDGGQDEEGIVNSQVGEPGQSARLHARHWQAGHATNQAEHAKTEGEHGEGDEGFPRGRTGCLHYSAHLAAGIQHGSAIGGIVSGLLKLSLGLDVSRAALGLLHLGRMLGCNQGGIEHDQAEESSDSGDGAPPGQAAGDVDGLQKPLAGRGRAEAVVEAQFLEIAEVLGDVEERLGVECAEEVVGELEGIGRGGRRLGRRGRQRRRLDYGRLRLGRRLWRPFGGCLGCLGCLGGRGTRRLRLEGPEREVPRRTRTLGEHAGCSYSCRGAESDSRRGGR